MRVQTTRLCAVVFATALGVTGGHARAEIIERVVAVVDEQVVLLSDVRRRAAPFLESTLAGASSTAERKKRLKELYRRLLQNLVDEQLIQRAANEMHLAITKSEVDQAIARVRQQNNMKEEQFWAAVRQQGFSKQQYREDLRKQLLGLKVTNQRVRSRVNVAEEDVRERYDEQLRQARRTLRFRAAHIFFELPSGASATEVAAVRQRAEALRAKLSAETFDEAIEAHGGGDLGWLRQGDLPEALERGLLSLAPGQISDPVRGPSGMHIFLLRERQRGSQTLPSFEESRAQLRQQMLEEAMGRQQEIFLRQLRKEAVVELRL